MKTFMKVLSGVLFVSFLVLLSFSLPGRTSPFWITEFFSRSENPIAEITVKNYVEFTEGALAAGEMPFVAAPVSPSASPSPIVIVDGKEKPSAAPLGIAKIGGESLAVYRSALLFFRPAEGQQPDPAAIKHLSHHGLEVRELPLLEGRLPSAEARAVAVKDLESNGYVPAVLLPSGEKVIPTGELNVIPDPAVTAARFTEVAKSLGLSVIRSATRTNEWWLLKTRTRIPEEIFKACNALATAVPCRFAEPNWIRQVRKRSVPKDPLFKDQWHLKNTGQTSGTVGADIAAEKAWDITLGSPQVIVAVFDDGFDIGHADLPPGSALTHSRDFVRKTSLPRPADNDPEDPDNHGTSCWGLIAGLSNTRGIAGVAPGAKFMLLRTPMELDESETADGIRWAADHGAHVMSNSWGYSNPGSVVTSALAYARKSGRGGKGTLVLFASGNENANIGTTDDLSNDANVLAIGATTHQDKRTTYSNYGTGLFAVAPAGYSASAGLVTTDRTGSAGYNPGSYTSDAGNQFDGTSGACPIAAGIAALVFSVNPNLTADQVEEILKATADKVQASTAAYNASGHSSKYGFGRLNALAALTRAKAPVRTDTAPTQTGGVIVGTVKNKATAAAIPSAIVTLSTGPQNEGGAFRFDRLAPGTYSVVATAENFKKSSRTVTLAAGQTRTVNFSLTPIPLPSIVATVRKVNATGGVVYAQGVTVSLKGKVSKTAPTGWGETAGKAKFYDLPAGSYTLSWGGYSAGVTVVLGQTAYVDLGAAP